MRPPGAVQEHPLAGRFALKRRLKQREGVETWLGVDTADGQTVVVKLLAVDAVSTAARIRLEHEAEVLQRADVRARPVSIGVDGGMVYLVQPFIPGATLRDRLDQGPLCLASVLRIGIDVLTALHAVHCHGVVHRDVKPANVIVDEADPITSAVLIDFGFARSAWLDPEVRDEAVGTARYLAPEAAGALDMVVDERADLYSTGVVLFECLVGRVPFSGRTVGEVLRAHLTTAPPHVRPLRHETPAALDEVIHRLLAKDPGERYQSASAAADDLATIAHAVSLGDPDPVLTIGQRDRRRTLVEPAFVGRSDELVRLAALTAGGAGSTSGVVTLEAESGGGKTRLLDEFALQLDPSVLVLRGHGVDQAAPRPFQILEGVANGLALAVLDEPALAARIRARLGDRLAVAVAALPALGTALDVSSSDAGPEAHGAARTVDALSALLAALGSGDRPAVVLLDDFQWADHLTSTLLAEWQRSLVAESGDVSTQVVVVAAFRSDEVPASHPLRSVEPAAHLSLGPFRHEDVVRLCESMAGQLPPEAVATVVRLADGSPFMASAVLRGLVEAGALVHGDDGWVVHPIALADINTSRQAAVLLLRRIELLSSDTLRLLGAGAVLGKEFELDAVLDLVDVGTSDAAAGIEDARRRCIVWVDERRGVCAFTHDKLREALLERLGEQGRASLHRKAARRIEATDPSRVFDLSYHLNAAGDVDRALPYAVAAAEIARSRHALDVAVTHYRIAAIGAVRLPGDEGRRVYEGLADVLSLRGAYVEATAHFERALALADDPVDRAALEGKLGEVAFRCGDHTTARRRVEGALRQLGRRVPRTTIGFVAAALWEMTVQAGHTVAPRRLGRRSLAGSERVFLAVRLYSRLAYIFWFNAGRVPCAWAHLREMNLAERYPATPELAQAWSEHAPVMTMIPWYRRGITYARKSYEVRCSLEDRWGQGQSLHFYGVALYAASRYRECIDRCQQAVELMRRTGDRWEENTALWHIAFSHYRLGELDRAVEVARQVHESASAIGDQTARGISLSVWSRASNGRVPASLTSAELALGSDDVHKTTEVRLAEAVRLLHAGALSEASTMVDEAASLARAAGLRQEYVAAIFPWVATIRRVQAERAPLPARSRRPLRRSIRRAAAAARTAHRVARLYRNNLPHALRERGLVAAMAGRERRARRWLAASEAEAIRQDAAYELALTRVALAELDVASGRDTSDAAARLAAAELARLQPLDGDQGEPPVGPGSTLSLVDRFDSLLDVGRAIAAAPSPAAVYAAVEEAAITLLRGDRCQVVEVVDGSPMVDLAGSPGAAEEVSNTLLRAAVESRAPVIAGLGLDEDATESMVLSGARSLLCAPIECEGQVVACFYIVNRQVLRLFGENDLRLASFIATLAGATLEHVAGSEARFRSLVQNSSDVMTIVDHDGVIGYQSASVTRVFGFDAPELVGRRLEEWLHPEDAEKVLSFLAGSGQPGHSPTLVEHRVAHRDGTWRDVETALNDLGDEPVVRGVVLNTRDITERVVLEAELRRRASHDILTGLANRALFSERVEHAIARNARRSSPFALLLVDLDDFKSVNDSLGHAAGDVVLRAVAARLTASVRPGDTVARLGGDEFALLLVDAGLHRARAVGERVLAALSERVEVAGHEFHPRGSVGIVEGDAATTADDLVAAADAALYAAKGMGKHQLEVFQPAMRVTAVDRAGLRADIDGALAKGELRVVYQPVVGIAESDVAGFEALLRWHHPRRGLLTPDEFIPLAEESGAIVSIGAWVMRTACVQAGIWADLLSRPITMAVNLSARQLQHPGLLDDVTAAIAGAGIEPAMLVLEITESATVQDTEAAIRKLQALKELGVGVAIDDFGTGYSSLSYLRRFPVDLLKVDRSFVAGLQRSAEDHAIVEAVVHLAASFGLRTVAEGVETIGQLEVLTRLGCDFAQGFNWHRPCPADELGDWLVRRERRERRDLSADRLSVVIADDRMGVRASLRLALGVHGGFDVVGEAEDAEGAVREVGRLRPDVVVLDLNMPGGSGLHALPRLRAASPATTVVVLTALDPSTVPDAAALGVRAVLDKTTDFECVADRLAELAAVA